MHAPPVRFSPIQAAKAGSPKTVRARREGTVSHSLDFSGEEWLELEALSFPPFQIRGRAKMLRIQWMALAHMALGKAECLRRGRYGEPCANDAAWTSLLNGIAEKILTHFQPGDGNL